MTLVCAVFCTFSMPKIILHIKEKLPINLVVKNTWVECVATCLKPVRNNIEITWWKHFLFGRCKKTQIEAAWKACEVISWLEHRFLLTASEHTVTCVFTGHVFAFYSVLVHTTRVSVWEGDGFLPNALPLGSVWETGTADEHHYDLVHLRHHLTSKIFPRQKLHQFT